MTVRTDRHRGVPTAARPAAGARPSRLAALAAVVGLALACGDSGTAPQQTEINASRPHTQVSVDFEDATPGASAEGLGAVHADLHITSSTGSAVTVESHAAPSAYIAPNEALGYTSVDNACLGNPGGFRGPYGPIAGSDADSRYGRGLSDLGNEHEYTFTFGDAVVRSFSVLMLDYGDYNPEQATHHRVTLTAYDAGANVVDRDLLEFTSSAEIYPTDSEYGNLVLTGDACTAEPTVEPGVWAFTVEGGEIAEVVLSTVEGTDPNVVFDDIVFDRVDGSSAVAQRQRR